MQIYVSNNGVLKVESDQILSPHFLSKLHRIGTVLDLEPDEALLELFECYQSDLAADRCVAFLLSDTQPQPTPFYLTEDELNDCVWRCSSVIPIGISLSLVRQPNDSYLVTNTQAGVTEITDTVPNEGVVAYCLLKGYIT